MTINAKTNALEDAVIKHIFRDGTFSKPSAINVALYTAAPSDAGGGTEVSGGNYSRVTHGPSDATWAATSGTDGTTSNATAVDFPTPSADWGNITHFGIWATIDATPTLVYHGELTDPKNVNNGDDAPSFAPGTLVVTED